MSFPLPLHGGRTIPSFCMSAVSKHATARAAIPPRERLIVALDVPSALDAKRVVAALGDRCTFYKIGLQLIFAGGVALAGELRAQGKKIFLDAKLLDIDETVAKAVAGVVQLKADFLTVHGDAKALRAAVRSRGPAPLKILAVTALTGLDAQDLAAMGFAGGVEDYVMRRVDNALAADADGVIASGLEAAAIRARAGDRLLIVTPGIRSAGAPRHDQKRVVTPKDAIAAGADYLVVGREIVEAPDPRAAADNIHRQIEEALAHP